MNKKCLLDGVAARLLGGYVFSVLNASLRSPDDMGNMAMEGIMRPATGYPGVDFARAMIPHHRGGIDVAGVFALAKYERPLTSFNSRPMDSVHETP